MLVTIGSTSWYTLPTILLSKIYLSKCVDFYEECKSEGYNSFP